MHPQIPYTTLNLPHLSMIRVEKGSFLREGHEVTVSAFELSAFPVTQALWEAVMGKGSNPSHFEGPRRPVEQVSWYDAIAFCNRLNNLVGLPCCYFEDKECNWPYALEGELPNYGPVFYKPTPGAFRLPTEAEWEYAAQGGPFFTVTKYSSSDRLKDAAWYHENSCEETHQVELLQPNALGLYDMNGNVWEWSWDFYGEYFPRKQFNPLGSKKGLNRVFRGGSWYDNYDTHFRRSLRHKNNPINRYFFVGFRLARHLSP